MSVIVAAVLLLQAAQAAAPARPPPSAEDLPAWSRTPSAADMAAAYPPEASKANLAGSASLECTVAATGDLADCVVTGEAPAGAGFGAAAMAVAGKFQMPARSPSGAAMAGRTVAFPIRWLNPAKSQAPPIRTYDDAGRSGQVVFNCRVGDGRGYDNCVIVDAKPPGTNLFSLAGEAVMRAKAPARAAVGSRLYVVISVEAR
jgi:TonB family protein